VAFRYTVVCDSLGYVGYDVLEEPETVLQAIKDAGYDGADLPCRPGGMDAKRLRRLADAYGLDVPELLGAWAYHHAKEARSLASADAEERKRGIEYSKKGIDLCVEMGARFFEICAAQAMVPQVPFPRLPIKEMRRLFFDATKEVCQYAAERGITILFEPLNKYEAYPGLLTTIAEALSLIQALDMPNLGLQPDISHMYVGESSVPEALRLGGKYVRHMHVNETNRRPLGTGHADYKAIVRVLRDIGFDGYCAIYLPLMTQELVQLGGRGYGQGGARSEEALRLRPPLQPILEHSINYMQQMERLVDMERSLHEVGLPYC
jgi:D-psicose/D-tagatose/L-ribulose 3-epimerase